MTGEWLLMMMLCLGDNCNQYPIDTFELESQCEAAQLRANIRQKTIEAVGDTVFSCKRQGEQRV